MPEKLNYKSKKIRRLGENGINFKLKHRKAHNSLIFFLGDLLTRTGDREIGVTSGRVSMTLYVSVTGDRR